MKTITRRDEHIVLELQRGEAAFLAGLPGRLAAALRERGSPRLAADPATNEELHQLLDAELAARRAERHAAFARQLSAIPPAGGELTLTLDQAEQWLALLTDLRLALATRLGIRDDHWEKNLDLHAPLSPDHVLYLYLSNLQGALLNDGFGVD
jgi:hypothetical protein